MRCVVLYDDFDCGIRAKDFADFLATKFGQPPALALWRCDLLGFPEIAEAARENALVSDFVIVSLRGDRPLPFETCHWIDTWLNSAKGGITSLMVLFDPIRNDAQHMGCACTMLRIAASRAGADFFAGCPAGARRGTSANFDASGGETIEPRVRHSRHRELTRQELQAA